MNQEQKRVPRRGPVYFHRFLGVVFAILLGLIFLINLFHRDRSFSEAENRSLAGSPELSAATIGDGSYFSDLETYQSDQFFMRDTWMQLRFRLQRAFGRKSFDGVILGEDGYLMAEPVHMDSEKVVRSLKTMNAFAQSNPELKVYMMLVPGSAAILSDRIPKGIPIEDQIADIRRVEESLADPIQTIDAVGTLQAKKDDPIFYRTDHHWTSHGAYACFQALCQAMNINATNSYNIYTVSTTFQGTQASKSGCYESYDAIEVYEPTGIDNLYSVYYPETQVKSASIYVSECLNVKDQYTVFFGGNHGLIQIATTNENGRRLLLIKDSYANSMVQFLTPYFEMIDIVDPRYYYEDLAAQIRTDGITDVLFLYSANTFLEDSVLADVLPSPDE